MSLEGTVGLSTALLCLPTDCLAERNLAHMEKGEMVENNQVLLFKYANLSLWRGRGTKIVNGRDNTPELNDAYSVI